MPLTPNDWIFWYTGAGIWVLIAIITAVLCLVAVIFACAQSYHATRNYWWYYVVLAKLRDRYQLKPAQMRDAFCELGDDTVKAQEFMRKARSITNRITYRKRLSEGDDTIFSAVHCSWWKEQVVDPLDAHEDREGEEYWLSLCGNMFPTEAMTPFKDGVDYCPGCGKQISQTSSRPTKD